MTFSWAQIILMIITFAGTKGLPALHHDHVCPPPMSTPKDAVPYQIDAYQRLCLPQAQPIPLGQPAPVVPIPTTTQTQVELIPNAETAK